MVVASIPLQVLFLGTFEDVYYAGSCLSWNLRATLSYLKKSWGWYVSFESLAIYFPCRHDGVIRSIKSCCWLWLKPQKFGFAYLHYCKKWNIQEVRKWIVQEGLINTVTLTCGYPDLRTMATSLLAEALLFLWWQICCLQHLLLPLMTLQRLCSKSLLL